MRVAVIFQHEVLALPAIICIASACRLSPSNLDGEIGLRSWQPLTSPLRGKQQEGRNSRFGGRRGVFQDVRHQPSDHFDSMCARDSRDIRLEVGTRHEGPTFDELAVADAKSTEELVEERGERANRQAWSELDQRCCGRGGVDVWCESDEGSRRGACDDVGCDIAGTVRTIACCSSEMQLSVHVEDAELFAWQVARSGGGVLEFRRMCEGPRGADDRLVAKPKPECGYVSQENSHGISVRLKVVDS